MTPIEQHLRVLELELGTSHDAIKESYRRLVMVWHPDRFSNDSELRTFAENRCKEINLAYEFLLAASPEQLNKREPRAKPPVIPTNGKTTESKPSPIQIGDVQYRETIVAQIVTERPRQVAPPELMELCYERAKSGDIDIQVGNETSTDRGVQLAMIFDSAKRIVRFPCPELIHVEFPSFAIAVIRVRDSSFKGDFSGKVGKSLRFAGWDGTTLPPGRNYFEAEYKLTKKAAALDIARIRTKDNRLAEDLRVWVNPKNLDDAARWVTNFLNNVR